MGALGFGFNAHQNFRTTPAKAVAPRQDRTKTDAPKLRSHIRPHYKSCSVLCLLKDVDNPCEDMHDNVDVE